jgi:hypothetical protein
MGTEQWLKLDVYFIGKPFTMKLMDRFGAAGVVTWIAFLAACKRSSVQGRVTYMSDIEARHELFIHDMPLKDDRGDPWTLDDFFTFTGKMKQTRKNAHGRVKNVTCTHWERWQNAQKTDDARERQRRSRAKNGCDNSVTENEREKEREIERAAVTSASTQGADATAKEATPATVPNGSLPDRAAVANLKASLRPYGTQP